jgi:hypothetical protein
VNRVLDTRRCASARRVRARHEADRHGHSRSGDRAGDAVDPARGRLRQRARSAADGRGSASV